MTKLEELAVKRYGILAEIKLLKEESSTLLCKKVYGEDLSGKSLLRITSSNTNDHKTCIEKIYDEYRELNHNAYDEYYSYDEIFENSDDEPCEHCKKVRANKKERMKLRRHFGQVNAAITRIGKRLAENG